MLFQSSEDYSRGAGFASSGRLATYISRPRVQLSRKLPVHAAEWLLLIISRLVGRAMQPSNCKWPAAPRSPACNIQHEILRIEARRRI